MMDDKSFRDLFDRALQVHRWEFQVDNKDIEQAIKTMHTEYSAKPWRDCSICSPINFNEPAYRCAYLHKYASCHAALVRKVLLTMLDEDAYTLKNNLLRCDPINVCCLGGGPGTDVIGLGSVFYFLEEFQNSDFHFTVVDCMVQWVYALMSVMKVTESGKYEALVSLMSSCKYLEANMLSPWLPEAVTEAIRAADMVTMVKFVSAAATEFTPHMLKMVFTLLKPGASVLFIDNAAGGFYEMVSEAAHICGLSTECGPYRHMKFENEVFKRKLFGFHSLSSTTVAAQMWRKNIVSWNCGINHLAPASSTLGGHTTRAQKKKSKRKMHQPSSTRKQTAQPIEAFARPTIPNWNDSQNFEHHGNRAQQDTLEHVKPDTVKSFGGEPVSFWQPDSLKAPLLKAKASFSFSINSPTMDNPRERNHEASLEKEKQCISKAYSTYGSLTQHNLNTALSQKERTSAISSINFPPKDDVTGEMHHISYEKVNHSSLKLSDDPKGVHVAVTSHPLATGEASDIQERQQAETKASSPMLSSDEEEISCCGCIIC